LSMQSLKKLRTTRRSESNDSYLREGELSGQA
jgi:hypothetical protein